eukprot:m.125778 g.125778  ORF g.125778 m.125778 type:complete len:1571 (+) comp9695_c0_seq3:1-4713(+)
MGLQVLRLSSDDGGAATLCVRSTDSAQCLLVQPGIARTAAPPSNIASAPVVAEVRALLGTVVLGAGLANSVSFLCVVTDARSIGSVAGTEMMQITRVALLPVQQCVADDHINREHLQLNEAERLRIMEQVKSRQVSVEDAVRRVISTGAQGLLDEARQIERLLASGSFYYGEGSHDLTVCLQSHPGYQAVPEWGPSGLLSVGFDGTAYCSTISPSPFFWNYAMWLDVVQHGVDGAFWLRRIMRGHIAFQSRVAGEGDLNLAVICRENRFRGTSPAAFHDVAMSHFFYEVEQLVDVNGQTHLCSFVQVFGELPLPGAMRTSKQLWLDIELAKLSLTRHARWLATRYSHFATRLCMDSEEGVTNDAYAMLEATFYELLTLPGFKSELNSFGVLPLSKHCTDQEAMEACSATGTSFGHAWVQQGNVLRRQRGVIELVGFDIDFAVLARNAQQSFAQQLERMGLGAQLARLREALQEAWRSLESSFGIWSSGSASSLSSISQLQGACATEKGTTLCQAFGLSPRYLFDLPFPVHRELLQAHLMELSNGRHIADQKVTVVTGSWDINNDKDVELENMQILRGPGLERFLKKLAGQVGDSSKKLVFAIGLQGIPESCKRAALMKIALQAASQLSSQTQRPLSLVSCSSYASVAQFLITSCNMLRSVTHVAEDTVWHSSHGAIGTRFRLGQTSMCFITCHLPPGMDAVEERVALLRQIETEMRFGGGLSVQSHHYTFLSGNLNFRIELPVRHRHAALRQLIADKDWAVLADSDQLRQQLALGNVLASFREGPLTFPPTSRFDRASEEYEASESKDAPAWTDRILWAALTSQDRASSSIALPLLRGTSVICHSYTHLNVIASSHHRPLAAVFGIRVVAAEDGEIANELASLDVNPLLGVCPELNATQQQTLTAQLGEDLLDLFRLEHDLFVLLSGKAAKDKLEQLGYPVFVAGSLRNMRTQATTTNPTAPGAKPASSAEPVAPTRRKHRKAPTAAVAWEKHQYYNERISRDDAEELLRNVRINGAFLVRQSEHETEDEGKRPFTLSFWAENKPHHYRIERGNDGNLVFKEASFPDLDAIVTKFQVESFFEDTRLRFPLTPGGVQFVHGLVTGGMKMATAVKVLAKPGFDASQQPSEAQQAPTRAPLFDTPPGSPTQSAPSSTVSSRRESILIDTSDMTFKSESERFRYTVLTQLKEGVISAEEAEKLLQQDILLALDEGDGNAIDDHSMPSAAAGQRRVNRLKNFGKGGKSMLAAGNQLRQRVRERVNLQLNQARKRFVSSASVKNEPSELGLSFVRMCLQAVEDRGLDEQGLYRLSAVKSRMERLVHMCFEKGRHINEVEVLETRTITSAVKYFFRQLPEPLLTVSARGAFLAAVDTGRNFTLPAAFDAMKRTIQNLPPINRDILKLLMRHLRKVANMHTVNKMSSFNLGVVFGPTLLSSPENALDDISAQNTVIEFMILRYFDLFDDPDRPADDHLEEEVCPEDEQFAEDIQQEEEAEDEDDDAEDGEGHADLMTAIAEYAYEPMNLGELVLTQGCLLIDVQATESPDWLWGRRSDGTEFGMFPASYVTIMSNQEA